MLVLLGFVLAAALLLRSYDLTARGMSHIEVYVPGIPLPAGISDPAPRLTIKDTLNGILVYQEPHPPAYYLFMLYWTKIFGSDLFALRFPSVLFGVGCILLLYGLGVLETNRWTALLAAILLAFNGHQVLWAEIAKMYIMACFLGLASTICLLLLVREAGNRILQVLYGLSMILGLATTIYVWPIFVTHLFWLLIRRWSFDSLVGFVRYWLLIFTLASPLLALIAFQSRRSSYLGEDLLGGLAQYLGFGFVFETDANALPSPILIALALPLALLGVFLFFSGLDGKPRQLRDQVFFAGPRTFLIAGAAIVAEIAILRFALYAAGFDPRVNGRVLATALVPIAAFIVAVLLGRYSRAVNSFAGALPRSLPMLDRWTSLGVLLALMPVGMIAILSPLIPLFASRGVLLYVPFLLLGIANGCWSLVHRSRRWLVLAPTLGVILLASVSLYKNSNIADPTDYGGLAEHWLPRIAPTDLIFIRPHWGTTPILYYLPANRAQIVGSDYAATLQRNPGARVWVFAPTGLTLDPAMYAALKNYTISEEMTARGAKAILYTNGDFVPHESTSKSETAPLLGFSTYLGGSQQDSIRDVAVDSQGNIYVTGGTQSPNFPTTQGTPPFNNGPCSTLGSGGRMDVFVTKFSPSGQMIWSRLIGGPCYDRAYAIEVDKQGYSYVAGRAGQGFPTSPNSVQPNFGGQSDPYGLYGAQDGFVAKLSPDGRQVVWSTYFGGNDLSIIRDMALDSSGTVYIVLPDVHQPNPHITANAYQTHLQGGGDGVIAKLAGDGTRVIWATYFGGTGNDGGGASIRVDSAGYVFVEGTTASTDLPTTPNAFQKTFGGTLDLFVTKFKPDGTGLVYSTYLGGSNEESTETHHLAVDRNGNAFVSGYVNSSNYPTTPGTFQPKLAGGYDIALAKFSPNGQLLASTYLGGSAGEGPQGLAVDSSGNVVVFGASSSSNYPLTSDAYQNHNAGDEDFVVSKLSSDLRNLLYSTEYGGSQLDQGRAGAPDASDNIVTAGWTRSVNFPIKNAFQPKLQGAEDASIVKLAFSTAPPPTPTSLPNNSSLIDDSDPRLRYRGQWKSRTDENAVNGTFHSAWGRKGAAVVMTCKFTGTSVKVYYIAARNRGKAKVWIDGVRVGTIDQYAPGVTYGRFKSFAGLGSGEHKIKLKNAGGKNINSPKSIIDVDALEISF